MGSNLSVTKRVVTKGILYDKETIIFSNNADNFIGLVAEHKQNEGKRYEDNRKYLLHRRKR